MDAPDPTARASWRGRLAAHLLGAVLLLEAALDEAGDLFLVLDPHSQGLRELLPPQLLDAREGALGHDLELLGIGAGGAADEVKQQHEQGGQPGQVGLSAVGRATLA